MSRGSRRINNLSLGSSIEILFAFWQKEIHQLRLQIKSSPWRQSLRNHHFHLWSIYLYSTKCFQAFLLELWVFVKARSVLKMIFIPPSVPTVIFYNSDAESLHEKIKMETFEKGNSNYWKLFLFFFCLCHIILSSPRTQWTSC